MRRRLAFLLAVMACAGVADAGSLFRQRRMPPASNTSAVLTVTKAGNGLGTVSSPAGIDCGPDCDQVLNRTTVATLTAVPNAGSTFSGWSGGCTGTGACVIAMTQSQTVTATFSSGAAPTPTLVWNDLNPPGSANNETSQSLERQTPCGGPWVGPTVFTIAADVTTYPDPTATTGDYEYRINATNAGGTSTYSNTLCVSVTPPAPGPPAFDAGTRGPTSIAYAATWAPSISQPTGTPAPLYQWQGGYTDVSPPPSGTTTTPSLSVVLPNRSSDSNAYLCVRAQTATGVLSVDQSCTGFFVPAVIAPSTVTAAGCSQQNIIDAMNTPGFTDGWTVQVPAQSCTWQGKLTINKGITLIGTNRQTVITDGKVRAAGGDGILLVANIPDGQVFRLSGFTWQSDGVQPASDQTIQLSGCSINGPSYRIDNNYFNLIRANSVIGTFGSLYGVTDHNDGLGYSAGHMIVPNNFTWPRNGLTCSGGPTNAWGDGSWASPLAPGTNKAHYVEDNTWWPQNFSGDIIDAQFGSRVVARYNMVTNTFIGTHGTDTTGRNRGSRWMEVYENTFKFTAGVGVPWVVWMRGGSGVVFNNNIDLPDRSVGINWYVYHHNLRSNDNDPSHGIFSPWNSNTNQRPACDGTARWDGNTGGPPCAHDDASIQTCVAGYPCLDQPGRGTSVDYGDINDTQAVSPATNGKANNASEPIYVWNNKIQGVPDNCGTSGYGCGSDGVVVAGRDILYGTARPGYPVTTLPNGRVTGYTYPHPLTLLP